MKALATKAIEAKGKWNCKIYKDAIYINSVKHEVSNRIEFIKALVEVEYNNSDAAYRAQRMRTVAEVYNINLPELAKSNPECRELSNKYMNGDVSALYEFFKEYAGIASEADFYTRNFTSPADGGYKSF